MKYRENIIISLVNYFGKRKVKLKIHHYIKLEKEKSNYSK